MGSPTLHSDTQRAQLAHNIQVLLDALEISQAELARRSGVSQKQVNNICQERTGCGIDALDAIGHVVGVSAWLLLHPSLERVVQNPARFERMVASYLKMTDDRRAAVDLLVQHS